MKKDQFEAATLDLWMSTAIPLTQANLQYHTGLPRRKVREWAEELVSEGILDMDVDDKGEVIYSVPGAMRPSSGPRTFAEKERLQGLYEQVAGKRGRAATGGPSPSAARAGKQSVRGKLAELGDSPETAMTALAIARSARSELARGTAPGKKSLLVSGGLSVFFGPFGWLYAGSFKESIPAAAGYLLLAAILPSFMLLPLLGTAMPLSGIVGLIYAWQHNHNGERGALFTGNDDDES